MFINYNDIMFRIKNGMYIYLGSGSSRRVYDLNNGYVVKVAKNEAGIEQNKAEYYISMNDFSGIFAEVIDVSHDYSMLIMKKAEKVRDMKIIWNYFYADNKREFRHSRTIQKLRNKYNLLFGDLNKTSSWGIIDRQPVIIDYGFTEYVERNYYH